MVSEPINSSLFHQLAEQLQQQNLEQFQKQLLEHQQKVAAAAQIRFSLVSVGAFSDQRRFFLSLQAISIEGQDSIFGPDNSLASTQNSSQAQLPESDTKLDDSIDNQQQVCLINGWEKNHDGAVARVRMCSNGWTVVGHGPG